MQGGRGLGQSEIVEQAVFKPHAPRSEREQLVMVPLSSVVMSQMQTRRNTLHPLPTQYSWTQQVTCAPIQYGGPYCAQCCTLWQILELKPACLCMLLRCWSAPLLVRGGAGMLLLVQWEFPEQEILNSNFVLRSFETFWNRQVLEWNWWGGGWCYVNVWNGFLGRVRL